jgi:hypothetical protein
MTQLDNLPVTHTNHMDAHSHDEDWSNEDMNYYFHHVVVCELLTCLTNHLQKLYLDEETANF